MINIDWDVMKITGTVNLALAIFWKLREITIAQIAAVTDKKFAEHEVRFDAKFAFKEDVKELRESVRHLQGEIINRQR